MQGFWAWVWEDGLHENLHWLDEASYEGKTMAEEHCSCDFHWYKIRSVALLFAVLLWVGLQMKLDGPGPPWPILGYITELE